jgi:hypothetical protein
MGTAATNANPQSVSVISVKNADVGVMGKKNEDKDTKEIERLRATNSLYSKYKPLWDFYLAAYLGGDRFANERNIFKHPREHPDDFKERAKRLFYHNMCYPLVDFYTTFIFAETIERTGGSFDEYSDFIKDVNKKGEDITTFMGQVSDDMQIFGMSYVLVDAPVKTGMLTKQQEKEQGIRPYWVKIRPDEILSWAVDQFDNFTYVKRVQPVTSVDAGFNEIRTEIYTEWTPDLIKISTIDVTEPTKPIYKGAREFRNEMGSIPLEAIRYKRDKADPFMGQSFIADISMISREVMNLTSLLQEFLYRQCFNILAVETDPNVPEKDQMQGEVGTANMLKYPQGAKPPQYITPPVDPAKFLQNERERNIALMYKIASQDTVNELYNGQKSSGYSKSQSFRTTVPKIATRADALERAETNLMKLTMKFMGKDWDGTIKYKDHYEITNLTDALAQMTQMFKDLQIKSKTFVASQMKRMVHEFDGKLTAEEINKVEKEIDSIDWDKWFEVMELALIGRAAMSPEAATALGDGSAPVKGKDTSTSASTAQRAQGTSAEIKKESRSA